MWGCTPTISTPGGRCRRISGSSRPARAAVSGVSSHLDCVSPLGSLEVCHYLLEFGLPTGTVPTVSRAHRLGQFAQVSSEERHASGVRCLEPLAQSWPESWLLLPVINTVPSGRLHFREPSSRKQSKKERKKNSRVICTGALWAAQIARANNGTTPGVFQHSLVLAPAVHE